MLPKMANVIKMNKFDLFQICASNLLTHHTIGLFRSARLMQNAPGCLLHSRGSHVMFANSNGYSDFEEMNTFRDMFRIQNDGNH